MIRAVNPRSGRPVGPHFPEPSGEQIARVAEAGAHALSDMRSIAPAQLAAGLRGVADALAQSRRDLVATADRESALGVVRLGGEFERMTGQIRMFSALIESGGSLHAVLSAGPVAGRALDLRKVNRALGLVAIFGASNFPFAFGALGGDTASALAAGCPVIAKAHPANPATSARLVAIARQALATVEWPDDALQVIHGADPAISRQLVCQEQVSAVGFTGSTTAGRAIFDMGAARSTPIPVYAELGSLNPMLIAPSAATPDRLAVIAQEIVGSVIGSAGQLCTKPGLILVPRRLAHHLSRLLAGLAAAYHPMPLLTPTMAARFEDTVSRLTSSRDLKVWRGALNKAGQAVPATIITTDAAELTRHPGLCDEIFGPAVVIVALDETADVAMIADQIGGSLTATIRGSADDPWVLAGFAAFEDRVGRILGDGVPTGVAVVDAMHHGGPYPASTSSIHTSVGPDAIVRFMRPTTYQDVADEHLPGSLRDGNPWGIVRTIDGIVTTQPVSEIRDAKDPS